MLFGPFRLDPVSGHLYKGDAAVPLAPKAYAVLQHLVTNAGRLVSKRELLDAVWPGVFVGDAVLKVAIGEIRKALGDNSKAPLYIETSHRRGYRFLAPVTDDSRAAARPPSVRYARSGDVNIAYQVAGDGPVDLVFVMGWVSHLEYFWNEPSFARFLTRLASMSRLILFDKRGTGLSDAVPTSRLPTLEQRMDDVRAVMDAVGSTRAVLMGVSEGGPMCSVFAATYPEKTQGLIMVGSYARRLRDADYPWGPTREERDAFCARLLDEWGGPVGLEERAPSMASDPAFREWWASYLRMGASPGAAVALTRMNADIDVRAVLPAIRVPALVLHRTGDRCLLVDEGRYLASRIPGARFVELPGHDHLPFAGDQDAMLGEIERFLATVPAAGLSRRVLATIVSVRVTGNAGALQPIFISELARFRGRPGTSEGDALLGVFDGPVRAVQCAATIVAVARGRHLDARAGIHVGECDPDAPVGPVADASTRLAKLARPGEVLVSRTIVDLSPGSGLEFTPSAVDAFAFVVSGQLSAIS
ncbi:MAG TPA: alpha/beta fold hydrolase [Vicinamibacterales bacterium]